MLLTLYKIIFKSELMLRLLLLFLANVMLAAVYFVTRRNKDIRGYRYMVFHGLLRSTLFTLICFSAGGVFLALAEQHADFMLKWLPPFFRNACGTCLIRRVPFLLAIFFAFIFLRTAQQIIRDNENNYRYLNQGLIPLTPSFLHVGLWGWTIFFLLEAFFPALREGDNIFYKLMRVYTLWCVVLLGSYGWIWFVSHNLYERESKNYFIRKNVLRVIRLPVSAFFLLSTIFYTASVFFPTFIRQDHYPYYLIFFICVIYGIYKFVSLMEVYFHTNYQADRMNLNRTLIYGVGNVTRVFLASIFLIIFVGLITGGDITSNLFSILTATSVLFALPLQPIVANFLSGLMIAFEGHFMVGHWVYFTNSKIEGVIEHLGVNAVTIRTFDKRIHYVPNSFFVGQDVVNASRMTHRRVLQEIFLGWTTSLAVLDKIVQEIRVIVHNHPGIDKTQKLMVHFRGYAPSGLQLTIYAYTKTTNLKTYLNVQENILRETKRIIEKHGGAPPLHVVDTMKAPPFRGLLPDEGAGGNDGEDLGPSLFR